MSQEYENLIDSLIKDGYLKTPQLIEAFKAIDRVDFVPQERKAEAYINAPLPIGFGQTISQPLTVAFMMELLEPKPGEKILDVGSGSGWTTALLCYAVSDKNFASQPEAETFQAGKVIGMERIGELKEMAEKNISKYNFIEKGIARIVLADGSKGFKNEAPFDKILAGASAQKDIPVSWKRQLKINGRIVAPVENSVVVIDKIAKNKYVKKDYFGFSFVPLISN